MMARYKRYFPVSHDINLDPEFDLLCKKTGLAGVRFFLQILSMLDKTENHISLNSGFNIQMLSRICGTKPKMLLTSYELLIDMKWIAVGVDEDMNMFIYAPNYAEYHRTQGRNSETFAQIGVPPIPSLPFPSQSLLKKEVKKENTMRVEDQKPQNGAVAQTAKKALMKSLAEKPETVSQETWDGFMDLRNKKGFPFTVAALKSTEREAEKVGYSLEDALLTCQRRGWRGFEARYVQSKLEEFI